MNLFHTHTTLRGLYTVHELLPSPLHHIDDEVLADPPEYSTPSQWEKALHPNEVQGKDIRANEDGVWKNITFEDENDKEGQKLPKGNRLDVSAAPIVHRSMRLFTLLRLSLLFIWILIGDPLLTDEPHLLCFCFSDPGRT